VGLNCLPNSVFEFWFLHFSLCCLIGLVFNITSTQTSYFARNTCPWPSVHSMYTLLRHVTLVHTNHTSNTSLHHVTLVHTNHTSNTSLHHVTLVHTNQQLFTTGGWRSLNFAIEDQYIMINIQVDVRQTVTESELMMSLDADNINEAIQINRRQ